MKIKQLIRLVLQLFIVMSLLITNISMVAADGGRGDVIIGQVSNSISKSLPKSKTGTGRIEPSLIKLLPSGGTATATAGLEWSYITMYSTATSSLSSNTVGVYNLCARVVRLIMNGVIQGQHSTPICGDRTGGGSVVDRLNKTVASGVKGKTWKADTYHNFVKSDNSFSWNIPNSVTAYP